MFGKTNRKILMVIFSICIVGLLCGCGQQEVLDNKNYVDEEKLSVLFEKNEVIFVSVTDELWPIALGGATFQIEDDYLVARDGNTNTFTLSNERQAVILRCLKQMEILLQNYCMNTDCCADIKTRKLFGEIPVIEFNFSDNNNIDSGIVYTTEQLEGGEYTKIKDNWYFYCYGLV